MSEPRGASILLDLPRRVRDMDAVDLVPRASLLLLVLNNRDDLPLLVGSALLCVVAFKQRRLYASPWLWLLVAAVMGARQAWAWERIDDHVVVTTYWALALGLGLRTSEPERFFAHNARLLLGLVFAFAAFWKLYSADFRSSTFFHYTLLIDDRFRWFAVHVGGLSPEAYAHNHVLEQQLRDPTSGQSVATLADTSRIPVLAAVMSWWGAASEAAMGAVFLAPLREGRAWLRHAVLFAFCATTYAIVPVGGFGVLLLTLGLAQAPRGTRLRVIYLAALVVMLGYAAIWRTLFYR